jgi:4-cresol dehydrogenase (hydroxylating)
MTLPPRVSQADFDDAIRAWKDAVGKDWVFTSDEDVALYRDAYSIFYGEPEERVASAAVAPYTAEEVQKVVRIANEHKIPLYAISTGRNLAYGGCAPLYSGSVVLDLKRMNRVLELDERNAFALVEPGVSYFDLYNAVTEKGLDVWIDPPDPGWGSVIGNALDGGGGWTAYPYRDHFGAHCGMEIVTAEGEIVRTGMGAVPNAKTWQHNKWGYGPWIDGLFRQGNMGVVTKMGFWLMPRPEAFQMGTAQVAKREDIIPLVDRLNLFENLHVVNGSTQIAGGVLGPAQPGAPAWQLQFPIYGPEIVVKAQMEYVKAKILEIPGAKFVVEDLIRTPLSPELKAKIGDRGQGGVKLVNFGIPTLSTFAMLARNQFGPGMGGHIGFSPIVPRTGEAILEFQDFYTKHLAEVQNGENLGIVGPVMMTNWERSLVCLIMFPIGRDKAMNAKMRAAFNKWVALAAERGWAEYRAPTVYQDLVSDTYSYNNNALRRFREKIKDAVDPNGILSPGRYGVWPKNIREA